MSEGFFPLSAVFSWSGVVRTRADLSWSGQGLNWWGISSLRGLDWAFVITLYRLSYLSHLILNHVSHDLWNLFKRERNISVPIIKLMKCCSFAYTTMLYGFMVEWLRALNSSSGGHVIGVWVWVPVMTLLSLSKMLFYNCFSPPRGIKGYHCLLVEPQIIFKFTCFPFSLVVFLFEETNTHDKSSYLCLRTPSDVNILGTVTLTTSFVVP